MSTVVMHNMVSVDGYIADDNDDVEPLFEGYFNGDVELVDGGPAKVSQASADFARPTWDSIGSMVIGRHLFDMTKGWEGTPPASEHVVVVSHRSKPDGWHPEASYHFIGEGATAITKAKAKERRATSVGKPSRWARWTRRRWMSCRWCSAPASGTARDLPGPAALDG